MFGIHFCDDHGSYTFAGDARSILRLAHLLENAKQEFTVTSVASGPVSQRAMGVGGFSYWRAF